MRKLLFLVLLCGSAIAATNTALLPPPHEQFLDANGKPLAGGKIYVCSAGTTCPGNPLSTWTDSTGLVSNPNPIVLDSTGYASIWINGSTLYKIVAQNSRGVQQWVQDNITSSTGYVQSGTGGVTRSSTDKASELPSVADYGAKADGTTDDTQAFNNALTAKTGKVITAAAANYAINGVVNIPTNTTLQLGPGIYQLGSAGQFYMSGAGSKLICPSGPEATTILVPGNYVINTGVIVLAGGEPSGWVEGCQIAFAQNDSASRASLIQYAAWAIYAKGQPRARIKNMKIVRAWNGITLEGNSGGATIDDVQISAFNYGLYIDGSQDTVRVSKYHFWPFGLTTNQSTAFYLPQAIGIFAGRVDGLLIDGALFFGGTGMRLDNTTVGGGNPIVFISHTAFDTFNGILMTGGRVSIADSYFTIGRTGVSAVFMTGGSLSISSSFIFLGIQTSTPMVSVTAGAEFALTGSILADITYDTERVFVNGSLSKAVVTGNTFEFFGATGLTFTQPLVWFDPGTRGTVSDNQFSDLGVGSGQAVHIVSDGGYIVHDNVLVGWTVNTPGGATTLKVHDNIP